MCSGFSWTTFYMKFADKLLEYKEDRTALIEKVTSAYQRTGYKLPTLEKDNELVDIDPFTIYALFNKGITNERRLKIIEALRDEFNVDAPIPEELDGIPVAFNMAATFYRFIDWRGEQDIQNLWDVFEAAIKHADNNTDESRMALVTAFDVVRMQKGIKWNITMGLYWIRPYQYLNLDTRNRIYMCYEKYVPADVAERAKVIGKMTKLPTAEEYLAYMDICKAALASPDFEWDSFPALSLMAWIQTTENERLWGHMEEPTEEELRKAMEERPTERGESTLGDTVKEGLHYWVYSPGANACNWDEYYENSIMRIGWGACGDLKQFRSKAEIKETLRTNYDTNFSYMHPGHMLWQFANEMQEGDVIFVKKGLHTIVGKGIVLSDYQFDDAESDMSHVRKVHWTDSGVWEITDTLALKTLTDITSYPELVTRLKELFESEEDVSEPVVSYPPYTPERFLEEVYMEEEDYCILTELLSEKKNIILQGAPGVGKTFIAKRLAYSMMGERNTDRVMMVQFHQSYSYEDFIMGFRPYKDGFKLEYGAFYNFCKQAEIDSENDYYLIIDEINRGNLSKIFGELFMLIEEDKRGPRNKLQLLYSDELFYVPENIFIIGMMNTADRSLAMLDYALRRRFAFYDLKPGFETTGFKKYQETLSNHELDELVQVIGELNSAIANDDSLGEGFVIGHSYFCNLTEAEIERGRLEKIVRFEILPMLKEYWFDNPTEVNKWSDRLRRAIR